VQFTAKFTTRKADQDTNNVYTLLINWYTLVCFPGCTLSWYLGTFSWLYTLLVSWYVFLVVHFVGILVHFVGTIILHHSKTSWLFNHRLVTLVADKFERQWL